MAHFMVIIDHHGHEDLKNEEFTSKVRRDPNLMLVLEAPFTNLVDAGRFLEVIINS